VTAENTTEETTVGDDAAVTAAGVSIPPVDDLDDVPAAVEYANANPSARWFVEQRVQALAADAALPWVEPDDAADDDDDEPDPDGDLPIRGPGGVQAAAAYCVRAWSTGRTPEPQVYDDLLADAAAAGMQNDPLVLSAVAWHERETRP
jgi:hypothetical protein